MIVADCAMDGIITPGCIFAVLVYTVAACACTAFDLRKGYLYSDDKIGRQ